MKNKQTITIKKHQSTLILSGTDVAGGGYISEFVAHYL